MHTAEVTPEWVMMKVATGRPFTLVLLKTGIPLPADKDEVTRLQMHHLTYLFELEKEDHICVFGPVTNDAILEGIIIFNTTDKDQVNKLMDLDPFIRSGHLIYEVHDFFTIPGQRVPDC